MLSQKIRSISTAATTLALSATPAFATYPGLGSITICAVIDKVIAFVFGLAGVIAVLYLIIGGIQYTVSGGDKAAVEAARGRITAAVIGLIIVIAAYLIAKTVVTILTGTMPACIEPGA